MLKSVCLRLLAVALVGAGATCAFATPVSSCANNSNDGITCNIYESDALGNPSETSNVITLPTTVGAGYVVAFETASGTFGNASSWSDVLLFGDGTGLATTMQLFSGDAISAALISAVMGSEAKASVVENAKSLATFTAGANIYKIHSEEETSSPVPEPGTLPLLATGLLGAGLFVKLRS